MRSVLIFVLALLPVSRPYSLPARHARLPRAAQRARRVALQEVEPDEYIPPLDVDVRLPHCEEVLQSVALTVLCHCAGYSGEDGASWL